MKIEDYFKYRIQGGDIYVLPEDIFNELFDELSNLQQENKQLSGIIDKAINKLGIYADKMIDNGNAYAICVDLLHLLKEVDK